MWLCLYATFIIDPLLFQFIPVSNQTKVIPERNGSHAAGDVLFQAHIPALGLATYFITKTSDRSVAAQPSVLKSHALGSFLSLKNEYLNIDFDPDTGLLKGITNLEESVSASVSQNFVFYKSMPGNNSEGEFQASGAYVFRPEEGGSKMISSKAQVVNVQVCSSYHRSNTCFDSPPPNWTKTSSFKRGVLPLGV